MQSQTFIKTSIININPVMVKPNAGKKMGKKWQENINDNRERVELMKNHGSE